MYILDEVKEKWACASSTSGSGRLVWLERVVVGYLASVCFLCLVFTLSSTAELCVHLDFPLCTV